MNSKEAVRTLGLMAGLVIGNLFARLLGFGTLVQLIFAVIAGAGVSYLAERMNSGRK